MIPEPPPLVGQRAGGAAAREAGRDGDAAGGAGAPRCLLGTAGTRRTGRPRAAGQKCHSNRIFVTVPAWKSIVMVLETLKLSL